MSQTSNPAPCRHSLLVRIMGRFLGSIGVALVVFPAAAAVQPIPLGPPVLVETYSRITTGPAGPSVAAGSGENYVVAWNGSGSVYTRTYDSGGAPRAAETVIGSSADSTYPEPDVSAGADGAFVAAWADHDRVVSQRFRVFGGPLGDVQPAAPLQASKQYTPAVARLATGGHVVVWGAFEEDRFREDLFGRRYGHRGLPLGPPFLIHRRRLLSQAYPDVAPLPDGGFVVVWQIFDIAGIPTRGIFLRFFDRLGRPRGPEIRVDSGTGGVQLNAKVAASSRTGETVVAWESHDSSGHGIFLRRFDGEGVPLGDEIQVNTTTLGYQVHPAVAISPQGDLVVVWNSNPVNSPVFRSELWARWFGRGGGAAGEELRVDLGTGAPWIPGVAMDGAGNFTVVWPDVDVSSGTARLLARRFAAPCDFGPAVALDEGRFQAEACWREPDRASGVALPFPLTSIAGAFWFFEADRPEVAVKVIDGRRINGHFWVYGTSLSSVQSLVRITDTETGEVRAYLSRPWELASFRDQEAFADGGPGSAPPDPSGGTAEPLLLQNGRFEVKATWQDDLGRQIDAPAVPVSQNTGYFWLADPENPFILVKILDTRPISSTAWVFIGAMSEVVTRVTITDTLTGKVLVYDKPAGLSRTLIDGFNFPL